MSNIDKQALRKELSNPAVGSKDHLRKLALALLDELESRDKQVAELVTGRLNLQWILNVYVHAYEEAKEQIAKDVEIKARLCRESNSLFDRLRAAEKRIAELQSVNDELTKFPDQIVSYVARLGTSEIGGHTKNVIYRAAQKVKDSAAGIGKGE